MVGVVWMWWLVIKKDINCLCSCKLCGHLCINNEKKVFYYWGGGEGENDINLPSSSLRYVGLPLFCLIMLLTNI